MITQFSKFWGPNKIRMGGGALSVYTIGTSRFERSFKNHNILFGLNF